MHSDRRPLAQAIGRRRSVSPHLLSIVLGIFASHRYRDHLSNLFKSLFPKTCIDAASTLPRWHPNRIGIEVSVLWIVLFSSWNAVAGMRR